MLSNTKCQDVTYTVRTDGFSYKCGLFRSPQRYIVSYYSTSRWWCLEELVWTTQTRGQHLGESEDTTVEEDFSALQGSMVSAVYALNVTDDCPARPKPAGFSGCETNNAHLLEIISLD